MEIKINLLSLLSLSLPATLHLLYLLFSRAPSLPSYTVPTCIYLWSRVCVLPLAIFSPSLLFLLSHYHATAGQAGASSTICVRFLYPTMERKAIRHLLAALKVFIGRRLEFIPVIPYQERAMLPQIHLFISFSFLSVALLAQCKKGNFSLCSPCKWVLDNQLWLTYTVGQRKSRKRVGKHSMSLEFYNRERDY